MHSKPEIITDGLELIYTARTGELLEFEVEARDADLPVSALSFLLDSDSAAAGMKIVSASTTLGKFRWQVPLDIETNTEFDIVITVTDPTQLSDSVNVTIKVTDVSTDPPVIVSPIPGVYNGNISVLFTLPEEPLPGSVLLSLLVAGETHTKITLPDDFGTQSSYSLSPRSWNISDGEYSLQLSYSDKLKNPVAVATVDNVFIDWDDCIGVNQCLNGGTCVNDLNEFVCSCASGFTGILCQEDIDECKGVDCGQGVCVPGVGNYTCTCDSGWYGEFCDTQNDFCGTISNPCQNGATCYSSEEGYVCKCVSGYVGTNCETEIDECQSQPCLQGGTCIDKLDGFECECLPGLEGEVCDINPDDCNTFGNRCANGGVCVDGLNSYSCECAPGWSGIDCTTEIDECAAEPCENGGICTDLLNGYTCACQPGYEGVDCELLIDNCAQNPCYNGGICMTEVNAYSCICPAGYTGAGCFQDIDYCASSPCLNGGECVDLLEGFECKCATGWSGHDCSLNKDDCTSIPCKNGGVCVDGFDDFTCSCPAGFIGTLCEIDVDECASKPCLNYGECVDKINGYTCICEAGFTGEACEIVVDACRFRPCLNAGVCFNQGVDFKCECAPGFSGQTCDTNIDDCTSESCSGHGTCVDGLNSFTCSCEAGYAGDDCRENVDDCKDVDCGQYGTCVDLVDDFACICTNSTFGRYCEQTVDHCESPKAICLNGAKCFSADNTHVCECTKGWAGEDCSVDIDECLSNPCFNNATCVESSIPGEFTCQCQLGFSGQLCNTFTSAPSVIGASVEATWDRIVVQFDSETNQTGSSRPCKEFLRTTLFGAAPVCNWEHPAVLTILSPGNDWTVFAGDVIEILPNSLFSKDGFSAPVAATNTTIGEAENAPLVNATLSTLQNISSCADIFLDASSSTGGAGREFKIIWELVKQDKDNLTKSEQNEIEEHLASINQLLGTPFSPRMTIPDTMVPPGRTYKWKATLQSWVGYANASVEVEVTKSSIEPPSVVLTKANALVKRSDTFKTTAQASLSTCEGSTEFSYLWEMLPSADVPEYFIPELIANSQTLQVADGVLIPGKNYKFQVTVTSSRNGQIQQTTSVASVDVEPVLAPTLQSAVYSVENVGIMLAFDSDTDRARMWKGSSCSDVIAVSTLAKIESGSVNSTTCRWTSDRHLLITWTGVPDALPLGTSIRVAGGKLKSADGYSEYARTHGTIFTAPTTLPVPQAFINGPSTIANCEGLAIDVNGSPGKAGRPFQEITWEVNTSVVGNTVSKLQHTRIALRLQDSKTAVLEIPGALLPAGNTYIFKANLKNWLEQEASAFFTVVKSAASIPTIRVDGLRTYFVSHEDAVFVNFTVLPSVCGGGTNNISTAWTQVTSLAYRNFTLDTNSLPLAIPSNSLFPGKTYSFRFNVWESLRPTINNSITIDVNVQVVAPPAVIMARFEDSMNVVLIHFDKATSTPGGGCDAILSSSTVQKLGSGAVCQWMEAKVYGVQLGSWFSLEPGQTLSLLPNIIRSRDTLSNPAPALQFTVAPAANPIPPVARINGPAKISSCSALTLNGGSSSGNAGRPLTFEWKIVRSSYLTKLSPSEYDQIDFFLQTQTKDELVIPNDVLPAGRAYQVQVTVTTWMGSSSTASTVVTKAPIPIPLVRIADVSTRVVNRHDRFTALVDVAAAPCGDSTPGHKIGWKVLDSSTDPSFVIPSRSVDKQLFVVPPNTFKAGSTMRFRVTVSMTNDPAVKNSADLTVIVSSTPLIATIGGGNRVHSLNRGDGKLILDASGSRDPDVANDIDPDLQVEWKCHLKVSGGPCFSHANEAAILTNTKVLEIPASELYINAEGDMFVFTIRVRKTFRSASVYVEVKVTTDIVPDVYIASTNLNQNTIARDQVLTLEGFLISPAQGDEVYTWTCTSDNFELLPENLLVGPTGKSLSIRANKLVPTVTYVFELQVYRPSNPERIGRASVPVTVNSPPFGGSCSVEPASGVALETKFKLKCVNWEDVHYPLKYAFATTRPTGVADPIFFQGEAIRDIAMFQGNNVIEAIFPEGSHMVIAYIQDTLGSIATYKFNLTATAPRIGDDFAERISDDLSAIVAAGDYNTFLQSIQSTLSSMEPVDNNGNDSGRRLLASGELTLVQLTVLRTQMGLSVLEMFRNTYPDVNTLRQVLQMSADISKVSEELDCNGRAPLTQLLQEAVQIFYTDTSIPNSLDITVAIMDSYSNLISSVTQEIQRGSSQAFGCNSALLSDAQRLAQGQLDSVTKVTHRRLQTSLTGQLPQVVSAGRMCVISQRNYANQYSDLYLGLCGNARDNYEASSSNTPEQPMIELPASALVQAGSKELDMVIIINVDDPFSWANTSNTRTDVVSQSGLISLTFYELPSFWGGTEFREYLLKNLSEPIIISIPHTEPLLGTAEEGEAVCRFWDEGNSIYSTEGCSINANMSTLNRTVCECNHLTSFSVATISPWFAPILEGLTKQDIDELTIGNILLSPGPAMMLLLLVALYVLLFPVGVYWDYVRKRKFASEFVFDIDETFSMREIGSASFDLGELARDGRASEELLFKGVNGQRMEKVKALLSCYNFRAKRRRSSINVVGDVKNDQILLRISVVDMVSIEDVVAGVFVQGADGAFRPYARTELALRVRSHNFQRRIVLPSNLPANKETKMMVVVFQDTTHYGEIEDVDPVTNEIFVTKERLPDSKKIKFWRQILPNFFSQHRWLSISSDAIHDLSSVQRLSLALVAEFSVLLIGALFFGRFSTNRPASVSEDIGIAILESVLVVPIFLVFRAAFRRTGPSIKARTMVDLKMAQGIYTSALTDLLGWLEGMKWAPEAEPNSGIEPLSRNHGPIHMAVRTTTSRKHRTEQSKSGVLQNEQYDKPARNNYIFEQSKNDGEEVSQWSALRASKEGQSSLLSPSKSAGMSAGWEKLKTLQDELPETSKTDNQRSSQSPTSVNSINGPANPIFLNPGNTVGGFAMTTSDKPAEQVSLPQTISVAHVEPANAVHLEEPHMPRGGESSMQNPPVSTDEEEVEFGTWTTSAASSRPPSRSVIRQLSHDKLVSARRAKFASTQVQRDLNLMFSGRRSLAVPNQRFETDSACGTASGASPADELSMQSDDGLSLEGEEGVFVIGRSLSHAFNEAETESGDAVVFTIQGTKDGAVQTETQADDPVRIIRPEDRKEVAELLHNSTGVSADGTDPATSVRLAPLVALPVSNIQPLVCERCEEEPADGRCADCSQTMCDTCFKACHKKPNRRSHRFFKLSFKDMGIQKIAAVKKALSDSNDADREGEDPVFLILPDGKKPDEIVTGASVRIATEQEDSEAAESLKVGNQIETNNQPGVQEAIEGPEDESVTQEPEEKLKPLSRPQIQIPTLRLPPQTILCDQCEEEDVIGRCAECACLFCQRCYKVKHKSSNRKHHTLYPLSRPEFIELPGPEDDGSADGLPHVLPVGPLGRRVKLCDRCEEYEGSGRCMECAQILCEICFEASHKKASRRAHMFRPLSNRLASLLPKQALPFPQIDPQAAASKFFTPMQCGRCEETDADGRCTDCNMTLCQRCFKATHKRPKKRSHNFYPLSVKKCRGLKSVPAKAVAEREGNNVNTKEIKGEGKEEVAEETTELDLSKLAQTVHNEASSEGKQESQDTTPLSDDLADVPQIKPGLVILRKSVLLGKTSRHRRLRAHERFLTRRGIKPGTDPSGLSDKFKYKVLANDHVFIDPLMNMYMTVPCFRWNGALHAEPPMPALKDTDSVSEKPINYESFLDERKKKKGAKDNVKAYKVDTFTLPMAEQVERYLQKERDRRSCRRVVGQCRWRLPSGCKYVLLLALLGYLAAASFFILLYGLKFDLEERAITVRARFVSIFFGFFFSPTYYSHVQNP